MNFFKIKRNSIQFKLFAGMLLVVIPLLSLLFYNNFYAIHVVRDQISLSNKNMISQRMHEIDENLNDVSKYLYQLAVTDPNLMEMNRTGSTDHYELSKLHLSNELSQDILLLKAVDSIFIYSIPNGDILKAYRYSIPGSYMIYNELIGRLSRQVDSNLDQTKEWYIESIGQENYLVSYFKMDNLLFGAWVNVKNLLVPLSYVNSGKNVTSLFATDHGVPAVNADFVRKLGIDLSGPMDNYYLSGSKEKFLVVGERSTKGQFSLIALVPDSEILKGLPIFTVIITACLVAALLLVPASLIILRRTVLLPLRRLLMVIKMVKEGNLNASIPPYRTSEEFEIVNESFNGMIKEIETLKINFYEEQLLKQEAELEYYQLQIKPHFFLNAINIIYNLAQVKKYGIIQELSISLSQYFRYMLQAHQYSVPLDKELKHVRNYLQIQGHRFPNRFHFEIEAAEAALPMPVPPLVIQTFVENSIKYAISMDRVTHLFVTAQLDRGNSESCLRIRIRDTGKGFPEDILLRLRLGERIVDEDEEHIGILNIRERLSRLYPGSEVRFSNGSGGGALVEITIPA